MIIKRYHDTSNNFMNELKWPEYPDGKYVKPGDKVKLVAVNTTTQSQDILSEGVLDRIVFKSDGTFGFGIGCIEFQSDETSEIAVDYPDIDPISKILYEAIELGMSNPSEKLVDEVVTTLTTQCYDLMRSQTAICENVSDAN